MIPGDKALYPGTDVMINKFDIRDGETARAVEYKFASVRELELAVSPIEGKFDFDHLKAVHEHLFQDMYDWAGQIRKIDFAKRSKETGMVSRFIPESVIDFKIEDFNSYIAEKNQLKGLTKPEFVKAITEVHTKLNELHPFREGNGRSTRVFLSQLAREAGFELNMEKIEKGRWNLASHRALAQHDPKDPSVKLVGNQSEMRQIFHEALKPTIEHSFRHDTRSDALSRYPQLQPAYERLDAIVGYTDKLPDRDAAVRLIAAERNRIADKLFASAKAHDRTEASTRLDHAKIGDKDGKSLTGVKDEYEMVASVMVDVLKSKGYSQQAIDRSMVEATKRLEAMRQAGQPAPVVERSNIVKTPEVNPSHQVQKNQDRQRTSGPSIDR